MRTLAGLAIAGVCGFGLYFINPNGELGHVLRNFFFIGIFLCLTILPHELGHAIMARLVGWRVYQIVVGIGKPILKTRLGNTRFEIRAIPLAGLTNMAPRNTRLLRTRLFLSVLAGPGVNALMIWGVFVFYDLGLREFDHLPSIAALFVWANFWVLVTNLWPRKPQDTMGLPTDGMRLFQLLSFRKEAMAEVHAMRFVWEAQLCRERGEIAAAREWCDKGLRQLPEQRALLSFSGVILMDQEDYKGAREIMIKLLEKEPAVNSRAMLMNNIAYVDALSGDPALLGEADAFSRDALAVLPWSAAVTGTRGNVLVAMGKYKEGIDLLRKSMEEADNPRSKADNACHLVHALIKTGSHLEAAKYLQLAKDLNAPTPLMEKAESALMSSRTEENAGQSRSCKATSECQLALEG